MFKRQKSSTLCNHKWRSKEVIVLDGKYPRRIKVCKICGTEIHQPIPTMKQLMEREIKIIRGEI